MPPREDTRAVLHETSPAGAPRDLVIEAGQRLSQSVLWTLHRRYFEEAGVSAWSTAAVPHYVTCNPAFAYAYAQVFMGLLRDCHAARDPSEPFTIVELGAGSGRFAYLFLRAITDLLRRSPLAGTRIRYVMTDFTDTLVGLWQAHDSLRPFVDQGVLDFARFDAASDREIRLVESGAILAPGSLANPLCVIANYVLDAIPQDAFSFEGGELHERLISIAAREPAEGPPGPRDLSSLDISFTGRPAPIDYYGDPALDAILRGYAAGGVDGATVFFPSTAIRCLARLAEISGGRALLIAADRGESSREALVRSDQFELLVHGGAMSLGVNFHAIAEYVAARGGVALQHAHDHAHLCVAGFLLGHHPSGYAETRFAYEEAIERAGPDDAYALRRELRSCIEIMDLPHALSLIRTSRWDPRTVSDCLPALWRHQPTASGHEAAEVVRAVTRAWESYYFIGEDQDLAFELALLLHAYGAHREALALFADSVRIHGDGARTRWNMGLCYYALGEIEPALDCFREVAKIDPTFVPAGAMQLKGATCA